MKFVTGLVIGAGVTLLSICFIMGAADEMEKRRRMTPVVLVPRGTQVL